jgi:uncharacterized protein (TIGR02246 family)
MAQGNTNTDQGLAARIHRLEDIEAIKVLKADYCAACDADHDPALVGPLFTDDAVWEAAGITRAEGRPAIEQYMQAVRDGGGLVRSAHNVFNPRIEVDGDTATGHWRLLMLATREPGDVYLRIIGSYRERYRRTAQGWRFAELFCDVEENAPYQMAAEHQAEADRQALQDVMLNYAAGVDERDMARYADCFAEDVEVVDFGPEPIRGREAWVRYVDQALKAYGPTQHMLGPQWARIEGDHAQTRSDVQALHYLADKPDTTLTLWATYETEMRRENGRWLISRHRLVPRGTRTQHG